MISGLQICPAKFTVPGARWTFHVSRCSFVADRSSQAIRLIIEALGMFPGNQILAHGIPLTIIKYETFWSISRVVLTVPSPFFKPIVLVSRREMEMYGQIGPIWMIVFRYIFSLNQPATDLWCSNGPSSSVSIYCRTFALTRASAR